MELHELQPKHTPKDKKRVGRGGKRGTYSGRGIKGQRAHAGGRLPSPKRQFISRFPKLRGTKFPRRVSSAVPVNVGDLERLFPDETVLTRDSFVHAGIIGKRRTERVKILGGGEVSTAYTITGVPVSASAKEKIEKAGGSVADV